MDANKQWMAKGNIGCTFASKFAKNPKSVNWITISKPENFSIPDDAMIVSIQFEGWSKNEVYNWAINNGFFVETTSENTTGLRYMVGDLVSWVQYFGPDSHVVTRQAPIPELMLCVRLSSKSYLKVGFKGILHLAHASVEGIRDRVADKLWETSFSKTRKLLGYAPTIEEAAKTTFKHG